MFEKRACNMKPILRTAATVAYKHHEKRDGSGYLRGTSGSERVYKKAWKLDDILELFKIRDRHND